MGREEEIQAAIGKVRTIPGLLDSIIERYGEDNPGTRANKNGEILEKSYGQLRKDAISLASFLQRKKMSGQRIVVIGNISHEWITIFYGILYSGNIIVPIDKDLDEKDIEKLMRQINAKALLIEECNKDKAAYLKGSFKDLDAFISFSEFGQGGIDGFMNIQTLFDGGDSAKSIKLDPEQDAIYVFTSGTTGDYKAVMLTHRNIVSNVAGGIHIFEAKYGPGNNILIVLPTHHLFGITSAILSPTFYGVSMCFGGGIPNFSNNLKTFGNYTLFFVPMAAEAMYNRIMAGVRRRGEEEKFKKGVKISGILRKIGIDARRKLFKDVLAELGGNLETVVCGGAFLDPFLIDRFDEIGIDLRNGYGISECSPTVAHSTRTEFRKGSVGKAFPKPYVEVKIIDGEICVKGPGVFRGYYNDGEATRNAFTDDGWFKTGDLGYIDEDGYIWITGRKNNLIVLSDGNNISPEEIEAHFDKLPIVKAVIVYGAKGARNSFIAALVHPDYDYAGSAEISDIKTAIQKEVDRINSKLPVFKRIEKVTIHASDFERTRLGKIKRHKHVGAML